MRVNLNILEVEEKDFKPQMEWEMRLGSAPRKAGSVVEGLIVPQGKVWLFPIGDNFTAIENVITGKRIIKSVNVK